MFHAGWKKLAGNGIHDRKIQFDDQASEFMSTKAHIIVFTYTKFSPCRTIIIQRIQWQLAFSATTMESRERLNGRELSSTIKDSCNVHFFGHWCHQCRYALPKLKDFYKFKKKNIYFQPGFTFCARSMFGGRKIYRFNSSKIVYKTASHCQRRWTGMVHRKSLDKIPNIAFLLAASLQSRNIRAEQQERRAMALPQFTIDSISLKLANNLRPDITLT